MKTKITLSITILFLCLTNTFAQNTTMAKAFYKKAQKAYAQKEYKDVITHIEKTKEHLGSTNPDIIYLEAKARLENDLNITKTKELLNQFLKDAPEDSRVEEVAGILADFETLAKSYYKNGDIRYKSYSLESEYEIIREYIHPKQGVYIDKLYNKNFSLIKKTFNAYGYKVISYKYDNGKIYSQTLFEYDEISNKNIKLMTHIIKSSDNLKHPISLTTARSDSNNNVENSVKLPLYTDIYQTTIHYKNERTITILNSGQIQVKENANDKTPSFIIYENVEIIEAYPNEWQKELGENHGQLKIVKETQSGNNFMLYYFNKKGEPEKREYYRKGKLKSSLSSKYLPNMKFWKMLKD